MDFRQTVQPNRPTPSSPQQPHASSDDSAKGSHVVQAGSGNQWLKVLTVVILVGIAILLAAIAFGFGHGKSDSGEVKYVNTSKYQAVFLSNGQVYFGKVQALNNQYIRMGDIYYLTQSDGSSSSGSSSNNNYSLIKLGCQQIHDPYDSMVINRDQVTFWENLQDDGKVVTSIKKFKQQNPNGPDCSQVSNQTQATGSNAQGNASSSSNTNSSNSSGH